MGELARLLTLLELAIIIFVMIYILVVKRDVLDPRLYVLYGIFHWLFVGQLYLVFDIGTYFNFVVYELAEFSDFEIVSGALLVLLSTCLFLLGYFSVAVQRKRNSNRRVFEIADIAGRLERGYGRRTRYAALVGFVFAVFVIYLGENKIIPIPITLLLPLGYLMPVVSVFMVFGIFLHFIRIKRFSSIDLLLLIIPLLMMAVITNIVLIYPLFVATILFAHRYLPKLSRLKIIFLILLAPVMVFSAMAIQLAGKIYRRVQNVGVDISATNFYSNESYSRSLERAIVTLDSFNTESFAVLLQSMRDYVNNDNFLYGGSLLSAFPMFKLFGGDSFQSFGRVFALEILGVSPQSNTAMAVTPIAEMAVNFSYAGTFFFYFLLGAFTFFAYEKFKSSRSIASVAVYLVLMVWLFLQQRGDFLNGNMYPAYVLIGVYVMARMFGRKYKFNIKETPELTKLRPRGEGAV